MKLFTLYYKQTKKIICTGHCSDEQFVYQGDDDHGVIEGHYPADIYYIDVDNSPVLKELRPDDDSDWDETEKKWKFNKQEAKQKLKKKLERERIRRDLADIVYDGKNVQADDEARGNIHGKLAEIAAAQALSQTISPLIWRDADNIDQVWTDIVTYHAWLQGLVMAIAARGTALYQSLWAHKAALAALDTAAEIKNYDTSAGW